MIEKLSSKFIWCKVFKNIVVAVYLASDKFILANFMTQCDKNKYMKNIWIASL